MMTSRYFVGFYTVFFCAVLTACSSKVVAVEPKTIEPCKNEPIPSAALPTWRFSRGVGINAAVTKALRECVGPATLPDDRFEKRCESLSTTVERNMCRGVCEDEHVRFVAEVSSCVSTVAINPAAPPTCFHAEPPWRKLCEARCAEEVAEKGASTRAGRTP
jgi:hypothetical protein